MSDNPLFDFVCFDQEQAAALSRLPKCDYCGDPIQDERFYRFHDENVCEECAKNHFYVWTENYTTE